ncbi:MAG: molybdenum cofactor guanylyltransferase [Chloroflexi bacterium]|nr:molybdenum cofactor guanylyltransferase [Chloroflexota bacterium]
MTRRPGVTAIVLAGGRSSRFGGPKLEAELGGATLLERAIRAVASVADEIVVAGSPSPVAVEVGGRPIRLVADAQPFAGPMAALAGALRGTESALAIVVGGDMPALVPAVLATMLLRLASDDGLDAVLLANPVEDSAARQVLPLAVRVAAASAAAATAMDAGDRSLGRFVDRVRSMEIPSAEWLALDPAGRTLLDVDLPADLERIRNEFR